MKRAIGILTILEVLLFSLWALNAIVAVWINGWLESSVFWKLTITLAIAIVLIGIVIGILLFARESKSDNDNLIN